MKNSFLSARSIFMSVLAIACMFVVSSMTSRVEAGFTQNDNIGEFRIDLLGSSQGVQSTSNVSIDSGAGTASLTSSGTGELITSEIMPASSDGWVEIIVDASFSSASDVLVNVYDCGGPGPIISGYADLTLINGSVDISGIDYSTHSCIQVGIELSSGVTEPVLNEVAVAWTPLPVFLIGHSSDESIVVGEEGKFLVPYSVSYSDATDVVIWSELPRESQSTVLNDTYGQDPDPRFVSASNGGELCDSSHADYGGGVCSTAGGIDVPEDSVFWYFDSITAGTTDKLFYVLGTNNGWKDGIVYETTASIDASNANLAQSDADPSTGAIDAVSTVLISEPSPRLDKYITGVIRIPNPTTGVDENYVYGSSAAVAQYRIEVENQLELNGRETIFNPIVVDDISDILTKLGDTDFDGTPDDTTYCDLGGDSIADRIDSADISHSGVLDVANTNITWNLSDLTPGIEEHLTFTVDFSGCKDRETVTSDPTYVIDNSVTFDGDNIEELIDEVELIVEVPPPGPFAKGNRVNLQRTEFDNSGNLTRVYSEWSQSTISGFDDPLLEILPGQETDAWQPYEDSFAYVLSKWASVTREEDLILYDRVPEDIDFVGIDIQDSFGSASAWQNVPLAYQPVIYYNSTDTDAATNPLVMPDITDSNYSVTTPENIFGTNWTTAQPANPEDVKWVAIHVPCLKARFSPTDADGRCHSNGATNDSIPWGINVLVNSKTKTPDTGFPEYDGSIPAQCLSYQRENIGAYKTYGLTDDPEAPTTNNLDDPFGYTDDNEWTHVRPAQPVLIASLIDGDTVLSPGQTGTYTVTVINSGTDAAYGPSVEFDIPELNIGNTPTRLNFLGASGGAVDLSSIGSGSISVNLDTIPIGETKDVVVEFSVPQGILSEDSFVLKATVTADDGASCVENTQLLEQPVDVVSSPDLSIFKDRYEELILPGEPIHYQISYLNSGNGASTSTYIVDKLAPKTVVEEVYTDGADPEGQTYTCAGCTVYFSQKSAPDLPINLTPLQPFDSSTIQEHFVIGIENSPGVWDSPFEEYTTYIAWEIDDPTLTPAQFPINELGKVGFRTINDEDPDPSNQQTSNTGDFIINSAGVFSNELLQAIGNQVITTILDDPALELSKTVSPSVIYAGESLDWYVEYTVTSTSGVDTLLLEDDLPYGMNLNSIFYDYNGGGEVDITNDANVTITYNADGTTSIDFDAIAYNGGAMSLNDGGILRLAVTSDTSYESGQIIINESKATFANATGGPFIITDPEPVLVQNPDLSINKQVGRTDILSGDRLDYTLIISNIGQHDAPGVVIQDVLPAGLCYVSSSSTVLTTDWSISEPTVNDGGDCLTNTTTLEWTSLDHSSLDAQLIPASSEQIFLTYKVDVSGSFAPGTDLTNTADISTTLPEDNLANNTDDVTVTVPYPDPSVTKTSTETLLPGEQYDYTIQYRNNTRSLAADVYLLDTLPDYDADTDADVTFVSVSTNNSEEVYYSDSPSNSIATFDPSNPTANGWVSDHTSLSGEVNHIAIKPSSGQLTELEGPHSILITVTAIDPSGGNVPAGQVLRNDVTIYISSDENGQTANNTDYAEPRVIAADLAITKSGQYEGSFPGITPGSNNSYVVQYQNLGTSEACGISITDTLPSELSPASPFTDFNAVTVYDATGVEQELVDQGSASINFTVVPQLETSGSTYTWYLGMTDAQTTNADPEHYENICLPAQSGGEFRLYVEVDESTADNTTVTNTISISKNIGPAEDVLTNNTDDSSVTIYRADVTTSKEGYTCGDDDDCGTLDAIDYSLVNEGETIEYQVEYNNIGNYSAEDVILFDKIPLGSCYQVGSLEVNQPASTTLEYSNDEGNTWSYTPVPDADGKDCLVSDFRLVFEVDLPVPAHYDSDFIPDPCAGTVGCWLFEEGDGDTVYDSSGNGNHGTIEDNVIASSGFNGGGALEFFGDGGRVEVVDDDTLDMQSHTIDIWVKDFVSVTGWDTVLRKGLYTNYAVMMNGSNQLYNNFYSTDATWQQELIGNLSGSGQWHNVVSTYDASTGTLVGYIDGIKVSEAVIVSGSESPTISSENLFFGSIDAACVSAGCYQGLLDDVRLYDKALTAEEISHDYFQWHNNKSPNNSSVSLTSSNDESIQIPNGLIGSYISGSTADASAGNRDLTQSSNIYAYTPVNPSGATYNGITDYYSNAQCTNAVDTGVRVDATVNPEIDAGGNVLGGVVAAKGTNYELNLTPNELGTTAAGFTTNILTDALPGLVINDVFFYDTTQDSEYGTGSTNDPLIWRFDGTKSWYTESVDADYASCDPTSDDRCGTAEFPEKSYIVSSNDYIHIFDAAENQMWMRFDRVVGGSGDTAISSNYRTPTTIHMAGGVLYNGGDDGSNGYLHAVSFILDNSIIYSPHGWSITEVLDAIGDRHNIGSYVNNSYGSATIAGNHVYDIDVNAVACDGTEISGSLCNGDGSHSSVRSIKAVAVATENGLSVINETDGNSISLQNITNLNTIAEPGVTYGVILNVQITSKGELYWTNDTDGTFQRRLFVIDDIGSHIGTQEAANVADRSYGSRQGYNVFMVPLDLISEVTGPFEGFVLMSDFEVFENESSINSDSNRIIYTSTKGVTIIDECNDLACDSDADGNAEDNGSVRFIDNSSMSEYMFGDVEASWGFEMYGSGTFSQESIGTTIPAGDDIRDNSYQANHSTTYVDVDVSEGVRCTGFNTGSGGGGLGDGFISDSTSHTMDVDNYTMGLWVYNTSTPTLGMLTQGTESIFLDARGISVNSVGTSWAWDWNTIDVPCALDEWCHIVMTRDDDGGGNMTLTRFVNGVNVGDVTYTAGTGNQTDFRFVDFGSVGTDNKIDEAFVTGEILSESEIRLMYESGKKSLEQGPMNACGTESSVPNANAFGAAGDRLYIATGGATIDEIDLASGSLISNYYPGGTIDTLDITSGGGYISGSTNTPSGRLIRKNDVSGLANIDGSTVVDISGRYDQQSGYYEMYQEGELVGRTNIGTSAMASSAVCTDFTLGALGVNDYVSYPFFGEIDNVDLYRYQYSASYETIVEADANILSWDKLYINESEPTGTHIEYTLGEWDGSSCDYTTPLFGPSNITNFSEITSIDPSNQDLCLKADLYSDDPILTPLLDDWQATYDSSSVPSFSFQTVVDNAQLLTDSIDNTVDNSVNILTSTPEIDTTNNQGFYALQLLTADLEIQKDVDQLAVSQADAATGTHDVNYTITYKNNGPFAAINPVIDDNFPADITSVGAITAGTTSNGQTVSCSVTGSGPYNLNCTFDDSVLEPEETGNITFPATLSASLTTGDNVINPVTIDGDTFDPVPSNNNDTALTVINSLPNLYIEKSGPLTTVGLTDQYTYILDYGNNGNAAASTVSITDVLDTPNISYVSYNQTAGTATFSCSETTGTVTCTVASLPAAETGTIEITVQVANDNNLLNPPYTIPNTASIATTDTEVTLSDNFNDHTVTVALQDLVSISGSVFVDYNQDQVFNSDASGNNDYGLENVEVVLTGTDIFGDPIAPVTEFTDSDGQYVFSGLYPGTYTVTQTQPTGYRSTGSTAGITGLIASGPSTGEPDYGTQDGTGSKEGGGDVNQITGIVVEDGENVILNDFGEILGEVGSRVFYDLDADGVYNSGAGDLPVIGVEVTIYTDVNDNQTYDSGIDTQVAVTKTDSNGNYLFNDLLLDDGIDSDYDYVVVVTDLDNLIYGMTNTTGTEPNPGVDPDPSDIGDDDYSKDATGEAVVLDATSELDYTIDFGFDPGSISNFIWLDIDADGVQDGGEPGLEDIQIFGVWPGPDGYLGDNSGTVGIDESLDDWVGALPGPDGIVGDDPNTPGTDESADDILHPTYAGNGTYVESLADITDGSGEYRFDFLPSGDYEITVKDSTLPTGLSQTYEEEEGATASPSTEHFSNYTLAAAEDTVLVDFGYAGSASLGDYIWYDLDGDGVQDAEEPGIEEIEVELIWAGPNGTFGDSDDISYPDDTTDANGSYGFSNLPAGNFRVTVDGTTLTTELGSGYVNTADPDSTLDSTTDTNLTTGETDNAIDFGYKGDASIGDTVFYDVDNDGGVYGTGTDLPLAGVDVWLTWAGPDGVLDTADDVSGNPATTGTVFAEFVDTTDASGNYGWIELFPGEYRVEVDIADLPGGMAPTHNLAGETDATLDSATVTTLSQGESEQGVDFGYTGTGSLGDYVWYDINQDGVQDIEEVDLQGIQVQLIWAGQDNNIATTADNHTYTIDTTDVSGNYLFSNLPAANYEVSLVSLPAGYSVTYNLEDGTTSPDSFANTSLTAGQDRTDVDFGLAGTGSIGDFVWFDTNGNGQQDAEAAVNGGSVAVMFNLYYDLDGDGTVEPNADDGGPIASDTIDSGGNYLFDNLLPDKYIVEAVIPSGYSATTPDQGANATDSDFSQSTDLSPEITIAAGQNDLTLDLGIFESVAVGDLIWNDIDGDGVQDAGEDGIQGITVNLYRDNGDSTPDTGADNFIGTTTTDADGLYSFTGLQPGGYFIEVVESGGYELTLQDKGGDDTADSDADPDNGLSAVVVVSSGTVDNDFDAGMYLANAALGNFVWDDLNLNGIQDEGEPGIDGVVVNLYQDTDGDGTIEYLGDDNVPANIEITAGGGFYQFTDLEDLTPGEYIIEFELPASYEGFTLPTEGSDTDVDSNVDSDGITAVIQLDEGELDMSIDAGVYRLASIGDYIWDDKNANGIQDVGEKGIDGSSILVTVNLLDQNGVQVDTTTADADGFYQFTDIIPGQYQIEVVVPSDYIVSPKQVGNDGELSSDLDSTTLRMDLTALSSGENDLSWDAGLYQLGAISGTIWHDEDYDGIQEGGEDERFEGIEVELYDEDDNLVSSITTDEDGNYQFTGLTPGDYYVVFPEIEDYSRSYDDQGEDDSIDSDSNKVTGQTEMITVVGGEESENWDAGVYLDEDQDQIPDIEEAGKDTDGDGIPDNEDYDPAGFMYDKDTLEIIAGGSISVTGPGEIMIEKDGSDGEYQWFTDGTQGQYTMEIFVPEGYKLDPELYDDTIFDPTGLDNPVILGGGRDGTTSKITEGGTIYYLQFEIGAGDPFIFNNNISLCPIDDGLEATGSNANLYFYVGGFLIFAVGIQRILVSSDRMDLTPTLSSEERE